MDEPLIPDRILRALRYVELVERGGGQLTDRDIEAFVRVPPPEPDFALSTHRRLLRALTFSFTEGIPEYMRDLGWIEGAPPRLTSAGRAIVAASQPVESDKSGAAQETETVVLSPEDPLNLYSLTGTVASARGGTLVEPYFEDGYIPWLIQETSIERLLLCRPTSKRSQLAFAAGAAEKMHRTLEVRCLARGAIHDRYLIAEDGTVSIIGASLNGLGRNFTVIAPVGEPGATAVTEYVESKWDEAEKVEPRIGLSAPLSEGQERSGERLSGV